MHTYLSQEQQRQRFRPSKSETQDKGYRGGLEGEVPVVAPRSTPATPRVHPLLEVAEVDLAATMKTCGRVHTGL
eukprot:126489-Prorocentrum_minimum.AAC.1